MFYCRIESYLAEPIAIVFHHLIAALANDRWPRLDDQLLATTTQNVTRRAVASIPRTGTRYCMRLRRGLRHGEVLTCLRPVSLVLNEITERGPATMQARYQWALEPIAEISRLRCDMRYRLNQFAGLNRRYWHTQCLQVARTADARLKTSLQHRAETETESVQSGSIGKNIGSVNMVNANIRRVNGKPIRR